jgi:hypothetical protein
MCRRRTPFGHRSLNPTSGSGTGFGGPGHQHATLCLHGSSDRSRSRAPLLPLGLMGQRLLFPVLPVAESVDTALRPESKMLGFRQPAELTWGALNGKMETRTSPDEIHGFVVEDANAPILRLLVLAITLCHLLMSTCLLHPRIVVWRFNWPGFGRTRGPLLPTESGADGEHAEGSWSSLQGTTGDGREARCMTFIWGRRGRESQSLTRGTRA